MKPPLLRMTIIRPLLYVKVISKVKQVSRKAHETAFALDNGSNHLSFESQPIEATLHDRVVPETQLKYEVNVHRPWTSFKSMKELMLEVIC